MGFGEEDGEEFDQVKVALVPVVELDVPDEFGIGGHVVVSDHAAIPPTAELHSDVTSDEVWARGKWEDLGPFPPHGSEGVAMVGTGGQRPKDLSPVGDIVRRVCGRMTKSCPLAAPPTYNRGRY